MKRCYKSKTNRYAMMATGSLLAIAGLSSCAVTDDAPDNYDSRSEEIRFAAATEFTRAGDITTNNLSRFYVYAYTDVNGAPSLFMNNTEVTKTSANSWAYSPLKYWPSGETVDFYAYAPEGWIPTLGKPFQPVPYDAYPGSTDLVYAVNPGLRGNLAGGNAQVVFNFRHALSKVTVKLSSSDSTLLVKVTNVALTNLKRKGNFSFPSERTSGTQSATNTGKWTDQNTDVSYVLHFAQDTTEIITLTSTPVDMSEQQHALGGPKYLIPQQLTWRSNGTGNDTYITVMCNIYDAKTGAKLWPNENTPKENTVPGSTFKDGLLKFPLSTSKFQSWEPGAHYIYSLVINSNDEMGPIEFGNPSVDTYIQVETNYK